MRNLAFNDFSGGMVTDPRDTRINVCRLCKGFDAFTYPNKLVPFRSSINADTNSAADQIIAFAYYGSTLYGLGVATGTITAQVFKKTDLTSTTWLTPVNNVSTGGLPDPYVFIYYHTKIYGLFKGTEVYAFDTTGGAFNSAVQALTYTNTAPALVHSKDDILYVPTDNIINSYNFGTSTWAAGSSAPLILPTNYVISNICEYGNYLAIACYDSGTGRSRVFLWDRNSSVTTLSESIDWGYGRLIVLEQIAGTLMGISLSDTTTGISTLNGRLTFRYYGGTGTTSTNASAGPGAVKFNEIISSGSGNGIASNIQCKQVVNDRLYFLMSFTLEGVLHEGVWAIGQGNTGAWAMNVAYLPNNDTGTTAGNLLNFFIIGDLCFTAYIIGGGGAHSVTVTDSQNNYNSTSYYETTINPLQPERYKLSSGMRTEKKQIIASRLCTEILTSGQTVVLSYRVEGGSWIELLTATADGLNVREGAAQDFNGNAITQGREYEFQIKSTGGAQITEFVYKLDESSTLFDPA